VTTGRGWRRRHPTRLAAFVQVDTSLARRHGGTGLGLPLTNILVELHGGRLQIESRVNEGTTVTVILPAATASLPLVRTIGAPLSRSASPPFLAWRRRDRLSRTRTCDPRHASGLIRLGHRVRPTQLVGADNLRALHARGSAKHAFTMGDSGPIPP